LPNQNADQEAEENKLLVQLLHECFLAGKEHEVLLLLYKGTQMELPLTHKFIPEI